jgi:hypothetical protein
LQFIVDRPWAYQGLALANLLTQFAPLGACFCVRWPLVRALFGGVFVVEMLGLDFVMGICNPLWFPLVAFFIDWDRLWSWLTCRAAAPDHPAPLTRAGWAQAAYACLFLGFFAYVGVFHVQARRWTYPFACFQMYSAIQAPRPYHVHQPYLVRTARWDVEAEPALTEHERRRLNLKHGALPWNGLDIDTALAQVRRELEAQSGRSVTSLTLDQVVLEVPPCQPRSSATDLAVCWSARVGEWRRDRKLALRLLPDPALAGHHFAVRAEGFKDPQIRFAYYAGLGGKEMRPLPGRWVGARYHFDRTGSEPYVIVALVRDETLGDAEVPFMGIIYGR